MKTCLYSGSIYSGLVGAHIACLVKTVLFDEDWRQDLYLSYSLGFGLAMGR